MEYIEELKEKNVAIELMRTMCISERSSHDCLMQYGRQVQKNSIAVQQAIEALVERVGSLNKSFRHRFTSGQMKSINAGIRVLLPKELKVTAAWLLWELAIESPAMATFKGLSTQAWINETHDEYTALVENRWKEYHKFN